MTFKNLFTLLIMMLGLSISSCKKTSSSAIHIIVEDSPRPNILWIMIEDWGPDLSCYGTKGVHTPHIDKLASEGLRYTNARTTSPVCSTSRSAMNTGMHQNYIRAHQHRTANKKPLPHNIKLMSQHLKDVGYYTTNKSKTDFNFTVENAFDGSDWSGRKKDQPFCAIVTISGTHRKWSRDPNRPIDIKDVEIPPYYPDTPYVRRDWANGLEQMQLVDQQVGALLKKLDDNGLKENTLVFVIGDHGRCLIRGKQFLYEGGIKIPLIVRWPAQIKKSQVLNNHVSAIDITATILKVAKAKVSYQLHGINLFDPKINDRKFTFAARDKMDNTHDAMRAIVGEHSDGKTYKLIHNLMPERAYCQYNWYKEARYPVLALMNVMYMKGQLNEVQAQFMQPNKPDFELFCLSNDPHEIKNLAKNPKHSSTFTSLKSKLDNWRKNVIHDQGVSREFRKGGWPTQYPTASLTEWENRLTLWKDWVFRTPKSKAKHPAKQFNYLALPEKSPKKSKKK